MDATNEQFNTAKVDLAKVTRQQAGLTAKLDTATRKLADSQERVGEIAAAAMRDGHLNMARSLLAGGSPETFLQRLMAYEQLSLEQKSVIDAAVSDSKAVDAAKSAVDAQVAKAATLQKTLAARKAQIAKDLKKWEELRRQLYAKAYGTNNTGTTVSYNGQASGSAATVVKFALAQQGKPYVFAADGPGSYDCSGLTMAAWRQVGVSLPHSAHRQYNQINHVSKANLQPGDLVFFYSDIHHVGIYIGGGKVVHAPTTGDVVRVADMSSMPYAGAGRP
jgi:cell wall-associated NlpC family hydrolase